MSDVTSALQKESIIGDVLAPGTKVSHNLKVIWPEAKLEKPGQWIDRDATKPKPAVLVEPIPEDKLSPPVYTLLMVDPDLTQRNDNKLGQVRHWLVTKTSVSAAGEVVVSHASEISPYVKPASVPSHLIIGEARPHRYTFILCRHKDSAPPSTFDPDTLRSAYEGEPGDLGGEYQDMIDRMRFNTQQFIERNGLEVVAATFMFVEGNVKSGLANAGLLAQSVVHKAVGL